jgi:CRISPR-associated protein Csh2
MFGSAMAVGGITKTFTGPIQMTWGYSLNPVDIIKSSSIVTIMNDDNSTFGKMYKAHYALVAHSGTVNKFAAAKTRLTENDKNLFSKALVQSMMNNLTHSKQGQQPLLYLEIIYSENFDGYLGDIRRFIKSEIHKENAIRSINDIAVNFEDLTSVINDMKTKGYIKDVIIWTSQLAKGFKNLPEARMVDLLLPIK